MARGEMPFVHKINRVFAGNGMARDVFALQDFEMTDANVTWKKAKAAITGDQVENDKNNEPKL
jgi:hypothetical protein